MRSLLAVAATLVATTAVNAFTIPGDIYVVLPSNLTPSLTTATRDVQRDLYKALGHVPFVLNGPPAPNSLEASAVVLYLGSLSTAPWLATIASPECFVGWESHCVHAATVAGYKSVVAAGFDERGAIFAGYSFSEIVLGVNPMYLYIDDVVPFQPTITVNDTLSVFFGVPKFKYRGWFLNDEDLLAEQFRDTLQLAAMDNRAYDNYFETAMRNKANLMLPATNPFPDQDVYALAAARGMAIIAHHYDLLGGNVFAWSNSLQSQDWDWRKDPGTMSAVWKSAIAALSKFPEVLWSIGLRGLNDEPYRACSGDEECGRFISEAMANQTQWIREAQGPNATVVAYLWQEQLGYLTAGTLQVPEGTLVLFTDAGNGFIRVDGNWSQYCDGVYYHTAMYDGIGNQLSEMVPVDRMITQFRAVFNGSKSNTVFIDNLSDLKPVPQTTAFLMKQAWDPSPYATGDPMQLALDFYAQWGATAHRIPGGAASAPAQAFAALWRDFLLLGYMQQGYSDNFYTSTLVNNLPPASAAIVSSGTVPTGAITALSNAVGVLGGPQVLQTLAALEQRAEALLPQLPASRQGFFVSHTLMQVTMASQAATAVVLSSDALAAAGAGNWSGAAANAGQALTAMEAVLAAMRAAEAASGPQWSGLYFGDRLTFMQSARAAVRQLVAALAGVKKPSTPLPPVWGLQDAWYAWDKEYQLTPRVAATYPFVKAFNYSISFSAMARINCVFAQVDAGLCLGNPTGGLYKAGSGANVTVQVLTSQTATEPLADSLGARAGMVYSGLSWQYLRYTLDGSAPTANSPYYVPYNPISLDAACAAMGKAAGCNVTITAAPFDAQGVQLGAERSTLWVAAL